MSAFVCQHTPLTESLCECWSLISKLSDQCIAIMVRALITDQHPSQEKRILYTHTHTLATFGRNVFCWDNFQNHEVCIIKNGLKRFWSDRLMVRMFISHWYLEREWFHRPEPAVFIDLEQPFDCNLSAGWWYVTRVLCTHGTGWSDRDRQVSKPDDHFLFCTKRVFFRLGVLGTWGLILTSSNSFWLIDYTAFLYYGNRDVCGVARAFWGWRVAGRGGVNLDVSADRDSQARVIFFAGG